MAKSPKRRALRSSSRWNQRSLRVDRNDTQKPLARLQLDKNDRQAATTEDPESHERAGNSIGHTTKQINGSKTNAVQQEQVSDHARYLRTDAATTESASAVVSIESDPSESEGYQIVAHNSKRNHQQTEDEISTDDDDIANKRTKHTYCHLFPCHSLNDIMSTLNSMRSDLNTFQTLFMAKLDENMLLMNDRILALENVVKGREGDASDEEGGNNPDSIEVPTRAEDLDEQEELHRRMRETSERDEIPTRGTRYIRKPTKIQRYCRRPNMPTFHHQTPFDPTRANESSRPWTRKQSRDRNEALVYTKVLTRDLNVLESREEDSSTGEADE